MDNKDIQPTGKDSFTLESGRLLMGEITRLGYSESTEDSLFNLFVHQKPGYTRIARHFERGVAFYQQLEKDWNVYRTDNGLRMLVPSADRLEKSILKKYFGSDWESYGLDSILRSDHPPEEVRDKREEVQEYLEAQGFLFSWGIDVGGQILGDQEVFGLDESEFDFSHILNRNEEIIRRGMTHNPEKSLMTSSYNPFKEDKRSVTAEPSKRLDSTSLDYIRIEIEKIESFYRGLAKMEHQRVVELPQGEYSCRVGRVGIEVSML